MPKWEVNGQLFFYDWENAVDDPRTESGKRPLFIEQPPIHAVVEAESDMDALDRAVGLRLRAAGKWECYRSGGANQVPDDTPLDNGIPPTVQDLADAVADHMAKCPKRPCEDEEANGLEACGECYQKVTTGT